MSTSAGFQYNFAEIQKAFSSNDASETLLTLSQTATAPATTTAGVFDLRSGVVKRNSMVFAEIFGTDAADETGQVRCVEWNKSGNGIWHPHNRITVAFTLGTQTGALAMDVLNTDLYADTITVVSGTSVSDIYSPADNTKAWFEFQIRGGGFLQWDVAHLTSTASINLMFKVI